MTNLQSLFEEYFLANGYMATGYKLRITGTELRSSGSDWVTVSLEITRPRCRKPFIAWEIPMNMVTGMVRMDAAQHFNLR